MFTGLVEDVGRIARLTPQSDSVILSIAPGKLACSELHLGESIAICGVCLTVTEIHESQFTVLAGAETLRVTTVGDWELGHRVNLERALRAGDRLGGHMMQGHVDGIAEVSVVSDHGANLVIGIRPPAQLLRYVIHKGSIAIDGVSLTVNRVDDRELSVALIPHTVQETNLGDLEVGDRVNLEVDVIGKYVERLMGAYR